jgi:hypothetical protein
MRVFTVFPGMPMMSATLPFLLIVDEIDDIPMFW